MVDQNKGFWLVWLVKTLAFEADFLLFAGITQLRCREWRRVMLPWLAPSAPRRIILNIWSCQSWGLSVPGCHGLVWTPCQASQAAPPLCSLKLWPNPAVYHFFKIACYLMSSHSGLYCLAFPFQLQSSPSPHHQSPPSWLLLPLHTSGPWLSSHILPHSVSRIRPSTPSGPWHSWSVNSSTQGNVSACIFVSLINRGLLEPD